MESSGLFQAHEKDMLAMAPVENDDFISQSSLKTGFKATHRGPGSTHPLESSIKSHDDRMLKIRLDMLRTTQGLHAPIQMQMELKTTSKGAKRLPCLPSTNLSREIILGDDIMISPKDIFNDPTQSEVMGDPHIMAERQAGLKSF